MSGLDLAAIRARFPALAREHDGQRVIWACAPGGTQVPESVIAAMAAYQRRGLSNLHGPFAASAEADELVAAARAAAARLLHAPDPEQIHFGQNTTSLHFQLSHALARDWAPGEAIVVTSLDHDSNVRPWVRAASARGLELRRWHFRTDDGCLHLEDLQPLLDRRVRLVAVTAAANALGSIVDVAAVSAAAHAVGARVLVDAVHLVPHRAVDLRQLDCDVLTCSAYKVFGPHLGLQWLRPELDAALEPDKVAPAPDRGAARWETGTVNLEALAGLVACVDYLAELGAGSDRAALERGYAAIAAHEAELSARFLAGAARIRGLQVHGLASADPARRTPTFGCTLAGWSSHELCRALGERGIYSWAGHFYALGVVEDLGLEAQGGLLRLGFVHYHTAEEIDRVLASLAELAGG